VRAPDFTGAPCQADPELWYSDNPTDKVAAECPSPASGKLVKILAQEDALAAQVKRILDCADHRSEVRVLDVRHQDADHLGPPVAQVPRELVSSVAEPSDNGEDAVARLWPDAGRTIEDPGCSRRGDCRQPGDVSDLEPFAGRHHEIAFRKR